METLDIAPPATETVDAADLLSPLLRAAVPSAPQPAATPPRIDGILVGELLALTGDGCVPLVRFDGPAGPQTASARSTVDLHGPHVGRSVVLMFEAGDADRPIVTGVLREASAWPEPQPPSAVQVDADGERLIVSAAEQLVLRCGKSCITLTKAGKVLIEGAYLLTRSTGVNRIKGGSIQLN